VLLAAVLGSILVVFAIRHEARSQSQQPSPLFGAQAAASAYQVVIQHAGFPFHLPDAAGYEVMSGGPYQPGRNPVLSIQYTSPRTGAILNVTEGVQRNPDVLQLTTSSPAGGVVVIRGRVWISYAHDGVLGTTMPDGVTVAVQGGNARERRAFAARIPVRAG
jgi:hypothetical protein